MAVEETLQTESRLDQMAWRLLRELQADARLSFSALARRVGMSTPAVAERVRRLEEAGAITGYHATVDRARLGRPLGAYLRLTTSASSYQRVIALCRSLDAVIECHHITGEDCFLIRLAVTSVTELEDVIARFRRFGTAHTSIVLSSPVAGKAASTP
ncbi:MAG: Lrp/AsnC family transcriptional regulator [Alphaproteobacteria bacterium]|nr:Lrp/AsnC family transcriptional regulator [Alphaproteobacteria bacterium]